MPKAVSYAIHYQQYDNQRFYRPKLLNLIGFAKRYSNYEFNTVIAMSGQCKQAPVCIIV